MKLFAFIKSFHLYIGKYYSSSDHNLSEHYKIIRAIGASSRVVRSFCKKEKAIRKFLQASMFSMILIGTLKLDWSFLKLSYRYTDTAAVF